MVRLSTGPKRICCTAGVVWPLSAVVMLVGAWLWGSGTVAAASEQASSPTYTGNVLPIFQSKCLGCHNSATRMGGLVMETYEALLKGGAHGPDLLPGKSSESRLVAMLEGRIAPQMPFGGEPLRSTEIAMIKAWIDAGVPMGTRALAEPPKPVIPDIKPQSAESSPVGSLSFSPDGKVLALGGYKEVRLMDAASGRVLATLNGHADMVRALAFSPDGKLLAAGGGLPARLGEIKLWDIQSRKLVRTLVGHKDNIYSLAISPDGKLLASGSYDKLIKVWDVESGKEVRTLKDHIDAVFAVAFSPDGKRLASGAQDRMVKLWDVATGRRLFTLSDPADSVTTVAFHPSGNELAAGSVDRAIRIWNLTGEAGTLAQSIVAHEATILSLVYSPDGKTLISTSADQTIKVWDAGTLTLVRVLEKQPDWVQAMGVSPDGKWLGAGRDDGTVSIYDMSSGQAVLGPLTAFELYRPMVEKSEGRPPTNEERR